MKVPYMSPVGEGGRRVETDDKYIKQWKLSKPWLLGWLWAYKYNNISVKWSTTVNIKQLGSLKRCSMTMSPLPTYLPSTCSSAICLAKINICPHFFSAQKTFFHFGHECVFIVWYCTVLQLFLAFQSVGGISR